MSHADKRSTHTDALETLGMIHTKPEARDAIHLAVEPVEAGESLEPGENILIRNGKAYGCRRDNGHAVGIVDPFLQNDVKKGDKFWLVLYPRTITSLRHVWSHPAFDAVPDLPVAKAGPTPQEEAYQWIVEYANRLTLMVAESYDGEYQDGVSAEELIDTAMSHVNSGSSWGGDYLVRGGAFEGVGTEREFWNKLAIYKGINIPEDDRNSFFSCSC